MNININLFYYLFCINLTIEIMHMPRWLCVAVLQPGECFKESQSTEAETSVVTEGWTEMVSSHSTAVVLSGDTPSPHPLPRSSSYRSWD